MALSLLSFSLLYFVYTCILDLCCIPFLFVEGCWTTAERLCSLLIFLARERFFYASFLLYLILAVRINLKSVHSISFFVCFCCFEEEWASLLFYSWVCCHAWLLLILKVSHKLKLMKWSQVVDFFFWAPRGSRTHLCNFGCGFFCFFCFWKKKC